MNFFMSCCACVFADTNKFAADARGTLGNARGAGAERSPGSRMVIK